MSPEVIAAACAFALACSGCSSNDNPRIGCLGDGDCKDPALVCCAATGYSCVAAGACPAASATTCAAAANIVPGGTVSAPEPPAGACMKSVKPSALAAGQVQAFGTHRVGDSVTFTVPAGTGSVTLVEQAVDAGPSVVFQGRVIENSAVPLDVTTPDGTKIYDDLTCCDADGGDPSRQYPVYFGGGGSSTLALTIPNATALLSAVYRDGGGLPAGTWKMTVNDYASECVGDPTCTDGGSPNGTYDVTVLTRQGLPTSGALDVSLYLVASTSGLNNQTAPASPAIQRFVQTLSSYYAQVGICVRTVTVSDVPVWAQNAYGTHIDADRTSPCSALDQMFTLSKPGNALNLFMVQSITSTATGGQQVVGIDGTIPGPSTIGGTIHSGAAVSIANLGSLGCSGAVDNSHCAPDNVAYIAAHEGGHFMGLFHTSESTGEFFDPLTDTATCRCETCVAASKVAGCNRDGSGPQVMALDCRKPDGTCGGGDDLMFWIFDDASQGKLSPQQGQVMRLNPVVQ